MLTAQGDVSLIMASRQPQSFGFQSIGAMLLAAADKAPQKIFLEQYIDGQWQSLSFEQARDQAARIARGLLALGLNGERPLAILSPNSIKHALMSLGAQLAGIPVAPVSVAYSQMEDLGRLTGILELLTPGAVFAEDVAHFRSAVSLVKQRGIAIITATDDTDREYIRFSDLRDSTSDVTLPALSCETVAKVLFTSGSTGVPKGVIITHGMMCSNQEAILDSWSFLAQDPPTLVDWLPWNHVFGGNLVFNCALRNLGTLVIDDGKPLPGRFQRTIDNIKRSPPTMHLSVPSALGELVKAMRGDAELAAAFFRRLKAIFSAGAALPQATWDALHDFARQYGLPEFRIYIGWGSTETAPVVSITPQDNTLCNNLGAPIGGARIKLASDQDKIELRIRGPMVFPGYWRNPEATAAAFDEEGFYRIGDAGKPVDYQRPGAGILFDGRVAENFKLVTGTWVQAGKLRVEAISAASPAIMDAVVTGHGRDEVGLLIFPDLAGCRTVAGAPDAKLSDLIANPSVHDAIRSGLSTFARGGSSTRIGRVLLLDTPPSIAQGEITDKGYINQRAVLAHRSALVALLYGDQLPPYAFKI
jgi:feruloyl-CoA synthase